MRKIIAIVTTDPIFIYSDMFIDAEDEKGFYALSERNKQGYINDYIFEEDLRITRINLIDEKD